MTGREQGRGLPDRWTGDINALLGHEDELAEHDVADRVFADRAEAFNAGRVLATVRARQAGAALTRGLVLANYDLADVCDSTLLAARVDPFGAAQWEVGCEFELGDGSCVAVTIDVATAAALGQALIVEATTSAKASDDEVDRHIRRHARCTRSSDDGDDELPF